jgi:hypothetical protein
VSDDLTEDSLNDTISSLVDRWRIERKRQMKEKCYLVDGQYIVTESILKMQKEWFEKGEKDDSWHNQI